MQKEYSVTLEKKVHEKTEELQNERNMLKNMNEDMRRDIALAKKIQEQIIPSGDPREYIASFYRPMDEMGGDYYDYISFPNSEKIGIFLSDVTGHGVPAAFITSMIKTIILQANERRDDPAGLLMHINDLLVDHMADNFVTAFYCVYDPGERSLVFANAGHNLPFIINGRGIHNPESVSCIPVGIMSVGELGKLNKFYRNNRLTLEPGSKLLLYTDGLSEARSLENPSELFEDSRLADIMEKNRDLDCAEFIDELYRGLREFRKWDSFEDDVCIICVDIR
jgi:sigma-B regulation protein RsbU (phosphoserine phosphatase)